LQRSVKYWAPGITILGIRVKKPKIPEAFIKKFEEIEAARMKAKSESELAKIETERKIAEKEGE
jgi:hypothetical protein